MCRAASAARRNGYFERQNSTIGSPCLIASVRCFRLATVEPTYHFCANSIHAADKISMISFCKSLPGLAGVSAPRRSAQRPESLRSRADDGRTRREQ
jgi:hypothetical protein